MRKFLAVSALTPIISIIALSSAHAGIVYTGGVGETVYGVAPYGNPVDAGAPTFFGNNITGYNDILTSPGHSFLTANPVVANNIADTGLNNLGLYSYYVGGGNGSGAFGSAHTLITGPRVSFDITDSAPGGGSASYAISSWTTNYSITAGGFAGDIGTFLSIGGRLPALGSAGVASLVSNYYINGVYVGETNPLVLAAAGNGNFQAAGDHAALVFNGNTYKGLAVDNIIATLNAGDTLKVVSTLTEYGDPAYIETIQPDLSLLPGVSLPYSVSDASGAAPTPEPSTWVLMLSAIGGIGAALRRRRRPARA